MENPNVRNIYCVGRNYSSFAKEMGNKVSETPIIFLKPTHSLVSMTGNVIELAGSVGEVNCEAEIVLHIGRDFQPGIQIDDLVNQFTVGLDFTYRELLNDVKKKGQPWMPAKGFRNSSLIGKFHTFKSESVKANDFKLLQNGEVLQVGNVRDMVFSLQTLVDFIGERYGLGQGDLIYTGTPEGIAKLQHQDTLEIQWGAENIGSCRVSLKS
ncbi:fumarylacetoacetate hydrolase [Cohnella kolymensis]|uniref:Fumarylacetoacetate hydrolase n=1 Tax=Cohnella kolymensis TaxID=1590652 RepID=A0ABR5A4E8_9BACL|nr:fumarylacetoacetate hydrolase family protein [Cohnella kolymensis]KIL35812.1 fumarylacetoacetate hydrolase [Cohnella kolymensis]